MIAVAVSAVGPVIIGLLVVYLLIPEQTNRLLFFLLSIGVGYGIFSWLVFCWLLLAGEASRGFVALEVALVVLAGGVAYRGRRAGRGIAAEKRPKMPWAVGATEKVLILGFIVVAAMAVVRYVLATRMAPYGSFDAWESYNMKARFILLSGRNWRQLFTAVPDPVPDYPLFLPLSVAGVLMSIGKDSLQVPVGIAMLFICGTVGMLLSMVGECRSRSQAALAGMVLLGTPFFVHLSFAQYADIPLSFFFLATMSLLVLYARGEPDDNRFLIVAGLTAGLSGWVKNEGLVFFFALSITYFAVSWRGRGWRRAVERLRMIAYGGAAPMLLALLFKLKFAGTNALVATQGRHGVLRKLLVPHRYVEVLEGFRYHLYHLASWPESILLLLAIYAALLGVRFEKRERTALLACAVTLLIMLGVYFVVLVGSPYDTPPFDVSWYILVTAPRLFMQLWPSFLFVYFLLIRIPDEIVTVSRSRPEPLTGG